MKKIFFCCALVILTAHPSKGQQNLLIETLPPEWQNDELFTATMPTDDFWWKKFDDALLDSLITIATERNLSATTALTNIRIAKAGWRMMQGELLPTLSLSTGWTREKASGNLSQTGDLEAWYGYFSGAISMSWEVDVFGKIFKRAQAQKRAFQATEEEYRATMVTLCAEVANAYFSLRQCQAEMMVLRDNAQSQKEIMDIVEARYETGFASKLDVAQARSVYYSTLASIPSMQSSIEQYINSLTVLLALYPGSLNERLENQRPLPDFVEAVAVGVPANLLRRRPDVRAAELTVEQKAALLGASKRDWLPTFYLNGTFGYSANNIDKLIRSRSMQWEIAPTMTWNIFSGGQRINATSEAKAELEQSIILFNSTVLTAVQEVSNAMSLYKNSILSISTLKETVRQGEETLELSLELYKQGLTQFQNVLDAQRSLLSYQDNLVRTQGYSLTALVQLYKALGGGW
ncbi:MAG: TolC family protein [Bacteroidaceae bacterium]|nr:TolC family protein [Bacteroidaceae bacterium]